MSDIAIRVEHLGKKYKLGGQQSGNLTFRESMIKTAKAPLRWMRGERKPEQTTFWALDDVSFDIEAGEAVGIIGRNGAGKSTLLKVLSRITKPTRGRVDIYGRVGSLLEVGTGFHSELSGRENIFLNGAFLGMRREEILRKFDEIVEFSGVEKFLDTPVKFYSSGMYVRLAFAVAAHLEPEILVVDEVLAVGDAEFQKKCLGKMSNVARQGRTVIFVSHNMNAIEELCKNCIFLNSGKIELYTRNVREAINLYFSSVLPSQSVTEWVSDGNSRHQTPYFTPTTFRVVNAENDLIRNAVRCDDELWIQIEGLVETLDPGLSIGYAIYAEDGRALYYSYITDTSEIDWPRVIRGKNFFQSKLPSHLLNEGMFRIELIGVMFNRFWLFPPGGDVPQFTLSVKGGFGASPYWRSPRPGDIAPVIKWESRRIA
jgi:lipopolysaccharide transport system ATP-binding protein